MSYFFKREINSSNFFFRTLLRVKQSTSDSFNAHKFEQANENLYSGNLHLRLELQKATNRYTELLGIYESRCNELLFAHAAIVENENQYQSILNIMPQIAWTTDSEGWVNFINERWYEYTGLKRTNSIVGSWGETVHPDDIESVGERYLSIMNSNTGGEFEARTLRHDGHYRWFLTRMQAIRDKHDKVLFWIGTATDIDDLKLIQQQKDDFINIASHELKTPLTSLKVAIQLLTERKEDIDPVMRNKLISKAGKSLDKVVNLVEDLLVMGTINKGNFLLNKSLFTLDQLLAEYEMALAHRGNYRLEFSGELSTVIYADAPRIEQVLINLINNAIKYAPESFIITIDIRKLPTTVLISVIDKGPGIEDDLLLHIFDPYYQVATTKSNSSGLGLGLSISAEIIQLHNGKINAESKQGSGTRFYFSLPSSQP